MSLRKCLMFVFIFYLRVTAYGPEYMYSQSQVDNGYEHLLLFLFVIKLSSNFGYVFSYFMV